MAPNKKGQEGPFYLVEFYDSARTYFEEKC